MVTKMVYVSLLECKPHRSVKIAALMLGTAIVPTEIIWPGYISELVFYFVKSLNQGGNSILNLA